MFLSNVKIKRPKTTKIQSKNGNSYVFQVVSSTYHPDKKYNTDKRVSIGKMVDDEFMIPNEKFALYYPELLSPNDETPDFSDTLKVGGFLIIDKVMEELGLLALLESTYDKVETIKDIIAYMILEQTSVYQHFSSFIFNHPSFEKKVRSESYISELLNDISDDEIQTFNTNWANLNAMSQKIYVHYDGTNMNTCSEGIEIAEFGHAKDNCDLPQVNISMATNSLDSTPLFYELYPGRIIDNSQRKYMVDLAEEYGLKDVGFILDRGYFSKSNMRYFREHGHEYIMMIKTNDESARALIQ